MLDTQCMKRHENLNDVDLLKPVYMLVETKMFPNEDGTLPAFGSIRIVGGHLGLEYTKQEFLDHMADLDWVTQVTYITSQYGFTGNMDVYRLN